MVNIQFDIRQKGTPFVPYWKKCIAAGRAAEGLREDWRQQLREVQREIGFEYIRFHGIFHDDMMIYREVEGGSVYNWQYLDSLFDFLLSVNLRPLLELSFMPSDLARGAGTTFWWKANTAPPKDFARWAELVSETVHHCINRYGLDEVLTWYFEVWNEPNLIGNFWFGTQEEYFKLYEMTARAIKAIDPRLRVGGPATADSGGIEPPWIRDFLVFCRDHAVPLDFVTWHPYPTTWALDDAGGGHQGFREVDSTPNDIRQLRSIIAESSFENLEVHLTEWNSSPSPRDLVHDTAFMAPFIIQNNLRALGLTNSLAFWTFTDVFEEGGAGRDLFHGGFGLINFQGLKKPSYYGYWFLSRLGNELLALGPSYCVSRQSDKVQIMLWNYCHYKPAFAQGDQSGLTFDSRYTIFEDRPACDFHLMVSGLDGRYKVREFTLDRQRGSIFDIWQECGAPACPTAEEIEWLSKRAVPDLHVRMLDGQDQFDRLVTVQPHGVSLIELQKYR